MSRRARTLVTLHKALASIISGAEEPAVMSSVMYSYLRALELEGRHPQDAGCWGATIRRMIAGEGIPYFVDQDDEIQVPAPKTEPLPPTPKLPPNRTRWSRSFCYRTLRSAAECERHLSLTKSKGIGNVAVPLTPAWVDPPRGVIPMPREDELLTGTHGLLIAACDPATRQFIFPNTWGASWGNKGYGRLPYDYVERYSFECWATYFTPSELGLYQEKWLSPTGLLRWSGRDPDDHRMYGFEVRDGKTQTRLGWAFAVERDGAVEVEELYVRPEFRRRGHGRWLADRMRELAGGKKVPLRLWVPFADARRESPTGLLPLVSLAGRMGLGFQPCPVRWAAYLATNERPGLATPVEPDYFPERPRSTIEELKAAAKAAMAVAIGQLGTTTPSEAVPASAAAVVTSATRNANDFPAVGSAEWGDMNRERAALIRKKVRGDLTPDERHRYELLQRLSLAALDDAFPIGRGE